MPRKNKVGEVHGTTGPLHSPQTQNLRKKCRTPQAIYEAYLLLERRFDRDMTLSPEETIVLDTLAWVLEEKQDLPEFEELDEDE